MLSRADTGSSLWPSSRRRAACGARSRESRVPDPPRARRRRKTCRCQAVRAANGMDPLVSSSSDLCCVRRIGSGCACCSASQRTSPPAVERAGIFTADDGGGLLPFCRREPAPR